MVRNVVLVRLKAGQDPAEVAEIQEAFRNLAIVADFKDADSYRAYDQDAEHNRVRARLAPDGRAD